MSEKLCVFCKHLGWDSISEDEYWGKDGGAFCRMKHFQEKRPDDESDLRALLLTAETCPDYERPQS